MRFFGLLLLVLCSCANGAARSNSSYKQVDHSLHQLITCWNQDNLNCVLRFYDKSKSTVYIGGEPTKTITGYKKISQHYRNRFTDGLGELNIIPVAHFNISHRAVLLIGRFTLSLDHKKSQGYTSLLWVKSNKHWVILADHSS